MNFSKQLLRSDVKPCPFGPKSPWRSYWDGVSQCFFFPNRRRTNKKKEIFLEGLQKANIPYKTFQHTREDGQEETTIWLEK